jgi:hypothetical protein
MQERERLWLVHPKLAVVNRGVRRAIMAARSRSR